MTKRPWLWMSTGAVLVLVAVALALTGGPPDEGGSGAELPQTPPSPDPLGHVSGARLAKPLPWNEVEVTIEGETHTVFIRRHDPPVLWSSLWPETLDTRTAHGLHGLWYRIVQQAETLEDARKTAELSVNPDESLASIERGAKQHSGWESYTRGVRNVARIDEEKAKLRGEAIIGEYFIVEYQPGDPRISMPLHRTLKRLPDGEYRTMSRWPRNVGALLRQARLSTLFEGEDDD